MRWVIFTYTIVLIFFPACRFEEESKGTEASFFNAEKGFFDFEKLFGIFNQDENTSFADLKEIKERGKLIALTGYGKSSYFVYKGTPMGFEHDLLQLLAKELDVKLEIVIVKDMDNIFEMLARGEGDLIADNLIITKANRKNVSFTLPYSYTRQVLVQKKPDNWKKMKIHEIEKMMVRNPADLIGKKIHVRKESAYYSRLRNLSEEIGGEIGIEVVTGENDTETLIQKVADGEIGFTIADEHIAMLNKIYFPDIDTDTPISLEQRLAWAVRETSPQLLEAINAWLKKIKSESTFAVIYNKYYKNHRVAEARIACMREFTCDSRISPFDDLIKKYAEEINWDWRLLASLIYQESRFNPQAKSWAGATGLMQLMPKTAQIFGVTNPEDPEQSLRGGTKYLKWLEKYWEEKIPDSEERLKFLLASYNAGQEHVADACRLAAKYNRDPGKWDDHVAYFLLNKSKPEYRNDPVVKYGYCRGQEPFNYVNEIFERYEHYKKLILEDVKIASKD